MRGAGSIDLDPEISDARLHERESISGRYPEVARQAILRTLAQLGLVDEAAPPATTGIRLLRLTQVIDKFHAGDTFSRAWSSYDPVQQGELIGTRDDGSLVPAPHDDHVVFPNPAALPGNEWFCFARASTRDLGP